MGTTILVEWPGFDAFDRDMRSAEAFDCLELMNLWADIIVEGNRRGVLAGLDGNNSPMPELSYRNGGPGDPARRGSRRRPYTGFGPHASGLHDNLTTAEYQHLTGPRLAPRGEQSRAIKNLFPEVHHDPGSGVWSVVAAWVDVVSEHGVPFLPYHFEGAGRLPRYDLRPVRPEDERVAAEAARQHGLKVLAGGV